MILVDSVTKRFAERTVVDDVSLRCPPGRVTALVGPAGSGKTVLLRTIVGLVRADSGQATIGGHRFVDLPNPGRHVGVMLEPPGNAGGRTGAQLLALSARVLRMPLDRIHEVAELVGLDPQTLHGRIRTYNLGARIRLGVAHALLGDPGVLLLDEPTLGMREHHDDWLARLLHSFSDRGGTTLLTGHRLADVDGLGQEIVLMSRGQVRAHGLVHELGSTFVSSEDDEGLRLALRRAGLRVRPGVDGITVTARPDLVGRIALEAGIALTGLAPADGRLEGMLTQLEQEARIPDQAGSPQRDPEPGRPVPDQRSRAHHGGAV